MSDKCPVDHSAASSSSKCPVDHTAPASSADACPVDHSARSTWASLNLPHSSSSPPTPIPSSTPSLLSQDREISSIPRGASDASQAEGEHKWVYPSEAQFYAAMARKGHNPRANDMRVVVPIHNAVNERAWFDVMRWERGRGGEACGGVRLISFKGRPKDVSPKARVLSLLGYSLPFDRHDWIVDRCGTRVRYVIDFYTGSGPGASFYLDARPALDGWEGLITLHY
ncbi:cytochrome c and c1 heme-lyase [Peniophora sp. CONT]|nr:cytochrome c and c1 heme-lyase [Peniophora sp. CONT]